MDKNDIVQQLGNIFEPNLLEEIVLKGVLRKFSEGAEIILIGQKITHFPLLLSGSIKVLTENEERQELLLYYLEIGDTCAMTLKCCMGDSKSNIRAEAEQDTELIMIPIQHMEEWMVKYSSWRRFIMNSYHERLTEMQEAIDNLAFYDLKERLIKYLRDKAMINGTGILNLTHNKIAEELNTSRVVISRLLKKLENENLITVGRNNIEVAEFM